MSAYLNNYKKTENTNDKNKNYNNFSFDENEEYKKDKNRFRSLSEKDDDDDDMNSNQDDTPYIEENKNEDFGKQEDIRNIFNGAVPNVIKKKSFLQLAEKNIFENINSKNKNYPNKTRNANQNKIGIQFREGDAEYNRKTIENNKEDFERFKNNFLSKMFNKTEKIDNANENDSNTNDHKEKIKFALIKINDVENSLYDKESDSKETTKRNKQSSDSLAISFLNSNTNKSRARNSSESVINSGKRRLNKLDASTNNLFKNESKKESIIRFSVQNSENILENKITNEASKHIVKVKNSQTSLASSTLSNRSNQKREEKLKLQNLELDCNKYRIKDKEKLNERLIQTFFMTKEEAELMKKYAYMSDDKEKRVFLVYEYMLIATLTEGFYFGDTALDSDNKKRTATIKCTDNSLLGFINRETYVNNIFIENELNKSKELRLLNEIIFLKPIKIMFFHKKYFRFFERKDVLKDEVIMEQSHALSKFIFVREGALELLFSGSLIDIDNVIKLLVMKLFEKNLIEVAEYKKLKREYCNKGFIQNYLL